MNTTRLGSIFSLFFSTCFSHELAKNEPNRLELLNFFWLLKEKTWLGEPSEWKGAGNKSNIDFEAWRILKCDSFYIYSSTVGFLLLELGTKIWFDGYMLHNVLVFKVVQVKFLVKIEWVVLPTFRRKVGFGLPRGSTVEVGGKFSGRFEVSGLRKNYFYRFIYIIIIYTHFFVPRGLEEVINQSSWNFSILW